MRIRTHIAGVAVGLVVAAIAAAPATAARPAGMTPQAYQAMVIRAQALNVMYGLGKPSAMTDAQYRAELIRGTALNERYGLAVPLAADDVATLYGTLTPVEPAAPAVVPVVTPGHAFDWTDALIGAGVAAGLLLLGGAGALTLRRHDHLRHLPHH